MAVKTSVFVPASNGMRIVQLLIEVHVTGKAAPLMRMERASSGAVPERVMRLRFVAKSEPPLEVMVNGAWREAACERMTFRLVAMKDLMPAGLPTLPPAAFMPLKRASRILSERAGVIMPLAASRSVCQ